MTQLASEAGAYVIGTGRSADRERALELGAQEFVDLENDKLHEVGEVDLVFDVIGGDIQKSSSALIKPGGTLVSVVGPVVGRPANSRAIDFVVEADRDQLGEIVKRVGDGRLRTNIGTIAIARRCRRNLQHQPAAPRERRSSEFAREDAASPRRTPYDPSAADTTSRASAWTSARCSGPLNDSA